MNFVEPEPLLAVVKGNRIHWAACKCGGRIHIPNSGELLACPDVQAHARCSKCGWPWDRVTLVES